MLVAGYVVALFAMQPRLGFVVDAIKERWGVRAFEQVMLAAAVGAGLAFALVAWRLWRRASQLDRGLLLVAAALYVVGTALLEIPQERLHYVEYGLLAGLIYVVCRREGVGTPASIVIAIAVTSTFGYLDEFLQGALWERRYFDWRDVQLNAQAAVLGTVAAVPLERTVRRR
jgi:hypothetical protein